MLNQRQERIFAAIVQEYVETAQPVASKTLVEKHHFDVSPATVRNDMAILEESGYLRQPHTSAGRIPTEEGYRYYLDRFVRQKRAPRVRVKLTIKASTVAPVNFREFMRQLSKSIANLSGETTFVSQSDGWHYYTGISKLFQKPEFCDVEMMQSLSKVVDQFDELIRVLVPKLDNKVNVWIGDENPFGQEMATVMVKYTNPKDVTGVLGLVGPQRMNYARNMKLLSEAREVLESRSV